MKKFGLSALTALLLIAVCAFGGMSVAFAADNEANADETKIANLAFCREVTFRDIKDVSKTITMYNYYPDQKGIDGSGCRDISVNGNVMTDGESNDWTGFKANSTAANTMGWAYLDLGEETEISHIKVHMLSAWGFSKVIIQVSTDALFEKNVTTVFSSTESLTVDGTTVYSGGKVGCNDETANTTGWNGVEHVNSYQDKGNVFDAGMVRARYVRLTNTNVGNGGADANTNFTEIEVYGVGESLANVIKSYTELPDAKELSLGVTLDEIEQSLPSKITVTLLDKTTKEIPLSFDCDDFEANKEGSYEFTAPIEIPSGIRDLNEVLPESVTITVTISAADTSALEGLLTELKTLEKNIYSERSFTPLEEKITEAEEALQEDFVRTERLESLIAQLNSLKGALQKKADKTALSETIAEAKAIDQTQYLSYSVKDLNAAIAAAETAYKYSDTTEKEAEEVLTVLTSEMNKKILKGSPDNLEALLSEISGAEYSAEDYTRETWLAFSDAIEDAVALLTEPEIAKSRLDKTYEQLISKRAGLVEYGNATKLKAIIGEYADLSAEDYTSASYKAVKEKLSAARIVAEQKCVQSVYDEAEQALTEAKENLVSLVALKNVLAEEISADDYTALSVQNYVETKNNVEWLLFKPNATAAEIAEGVETVNKAKSALAEKPDFTDISDDSSKSGKSGCGCGSSIVNVSGCLIAGLLLILLALSAMRAKRKE